MDVAIRGDRASCLSMQLGRRSWLFAVARGFGSVDALPASAAALRRLRAECERRARGERFRRALDRPQPAATALLGVLSRVNGDLFTQSAAHEDYVTAGTSLTALLVVCGRAFVVHAGSTAAYLAHRGDIVALTAEDALDDGMKTPLARAFGAAPSLDVSVTSIAVESGDVVMLMAHRVRGDVDRRALVAHVEDAGPGEQMLVVRFDDDDRAVDEPASPQRTQPRASATFVRLGVAAAMIVVVATVLALGWVH